MNLVLPVFHLFLPDGIPEGMKIIEKANWNGIGLFIPRECFNKHKDRPELKKPGVYLLIGDVDLEPKIYIGEGDPLLNRISQHNLKKDFWDSFIAFTSKDQSLNKASIQYLEARLYQIAKCTGLFNLNENKQVPTKPNLSDMDQAIAEEYLHALMLCLPILGMPFSQTIPKQTSEAELFFIRRENLEAKGIQIHSGFLVLKGSLALRGERPSCSQAIKIKRQSLINQGILKHTESGHLIFTQDYSSTSPSTSASIIFGGSINGRTTWKNANGSSLSDLEET